MGVSPRNHALFCNYDIYLSLIKKYSTANGSTKRHRNHIVSPHDLAIYPATCAQTSSLESNHITYGNLLQGFLLLLLELGIEEHDGVSHLRLHRKCGAASHIKQATCFDTIDNRSDSIPISLIQIVSNEFIALIKETSVVSFVGAADLYVAFSYIGSNSYEFMVPYLVMAVIYIVLVLLISLGIKVMERSLRKSDRRN